MGKISSTRALGLMRALLAFALSAVMGVAFVLLVNKTHDLFSSTTFEEQTVVGTLNSTWQDLRSMTVTIGRQIANLTAQVLEKS